MRSDEDHEPPARPAPIVRLRDVANEAGVHISTASRVLNDRRDKALSVETRQRVLDAAKRLKYRPSAAGRNLKQVSTGALGLLIPTLRNPIYSEIIRGAFEQAWKSQFVVLIAEDADDTAGSVAYERLVAEGRIDGLLIASAREDSAISARFEEHDVPRVFVNRRQPGSGRNVSMLEERAAKMSVEHLAGLGHRHIGHIAGPASIDTAKRRRDGFIDACRELGLAFNVIEMPFAEEGGYAAMNGLLDEPSVPSAVFVSNINQVVGAFGATHSRGVSVPEQLSIVGYDDDPLALFLGAPLTAIRMPFFPLGARSVRELMRQLEGYPARDIVLEEPPELIVRSSTGRPA